ncbi:DUF2064 domain-containing protein [Haloplanus halobius]|uniref:DUF2064 domain-containing protein n=1 Tax=Haloplanus halobius TaxID=2934938 RepID=UPI00200FA0A7|nr:DUF2064 domain-containing protein [Haloplanus sp. XH21]
MTTIAVLADPPRAGLVGTELAATSPLTESEAAECYAAALRDVLVAVERSGGDLLVNYRSDDLLPDELVTETESEAAVRALAAAALEDVSDVRFEPQVGSSFDARAGNTVTHLLREEAVNSVAVVDGAAAFLTRPLIDNAAMKLRRSEVVLGPSTRGRTYYAGFTEPVDFADAFQPPAMETLTARARDAGHDVDFIPIQPVIETGADLLDVLPLVNARVDAERIVPTNTAAFLDEVGLRVDYGDDGAHLVRE